MVYFDMFALGRFSFSLATVPLLVLPSRRAVLEVVNLSFSNVETVQCLHTSTLVIYYRLWNVWQSPNRPPHIPNTTGQQHICPRPVVFCEGR